MLQADGFDDAFIGIVSVDDEPLIAYSLSKTIDVLMGSGMSREDAMEYFSFNVEGAYVGKQKPLFIDDVHYGSLEDVREFH